MHSGTEGETSRKIAIVSGKGGVGKSVLTYVMDFIRYLDDLTRYRFFTGLLKRPLVGLHGELLTVKGKVLKEIGFGTPSLTEDFRFASELVRRRYKTWQSATKVSIKSPNSLGDLFKQRGRWFKGILKDLKYCPPLMKATVGLSMSLWILGVFGSWMFSPLWLFWKPFHFAIPGATAYWAAYSYGVWRSRKPYLLLAIPIFGVLESIAFLKCWRQKGFEVVDKN